MSLFKRGDTWWLYIVHHGRRIRKSTETSDRKAAHRIHDEFRAELWRHKPSGETVHSALEAWAKTADQPDRYRVGKLKRLYKDRPLHEATPESFTQILADNPSTFNRTAGLIQAALRKAGVDIKLKLVKEPAGRVRWLTDDEWRRLDRALPDYLRPLARFALATGLRKRNITHLEWSQVDLERRTAWIHADQAKGRRAIGIPLSDEAVAVLRSRRGIDERWVFSRDGKPMRQFQWVWEQALKKARIENFRWHDLRHTWASWHVRNGTRLEFLKELGGWATMSMVLRYAHLAPDHLAAYANNSKPRHVSGHKRRKSA